MSREVLVWSSTPSQEATQPAKKQEGEKATEELEGAGEAACAYREGKNRKGGNYSALSDSFWTEERGSYARAELRPRIGSQGDNSWPLLFGRILPSDLSESQFSVVVKSGKL